MSIDVEYRQQPDGQVGSQRWVQSDHDKDRTAAGAEERQIGLNQARRWGWAATADRDAADAAAAVATAGSTDTAVN